MRGVLYAVRALCNVPLFTAAVVLTLALGIAANVAVFTVADQVLLKPLPLPRSNELVRIQELHRRPANLTGATFHDLRERATAFRALFAYRIFTRNLADQAQSSIPEQVNVAYVSADFFDVASARPAIGQQFTPQDFRANAPAKVLLGHALWERLFGGDRGIVGRAVQFNGRPAMVSGVMPSGFSFPEDVQAWALLSGDMALAQNRRAHLFTTIGRLRPGVTLEQARVNLRTVGGAIDADNPGADSGLSLDATDLQTSIIGEIRPVVLILLGAVVLVLLIACGNAANLLLARGITRQKELAIRAALGATRRRLVWESLVECAVLAVAAGAIGVVLGELAVAVLASRYPGSVPRLRGMAMDWQVMLFALAASCSTALISALLPAWQSSHLDPASTMNSSARGTSRRTHHRARSVLLVSEIAMAVVLLAGAGLLIRSYLRVLQVEPGYDPKNLAVLPISLPDAKYDSFEKRLQFVNAAIANIRAIPGIRSVAVSGALPLRPVADTDFDLVGKPLPPGSEADADVFTITPEYFQTLRMPLLAGRTIASTDIRRAPTVALINQAMAEQYYANANPVGQMIIMKDWGDPLPAQIVGVVGDVRQNSLETAPKPAVFFSYAQFTQGTLVSYLTARTDGNPAKYESEMRRQIWHVDSQQPVEITTMETIIAESLAQRSFTLTLLASFAILALLLAVVGVYGLISYSVSQRTKEFGIRMAVGAQRSHVLRMVMTHGLLLAGLGLSLGLAAALGLTRSLQSLLFGVSNSDAVTYLGICLLLTILTMLACIGPAFKAIRADPMNVLRAE